jgi:selenide, water dikinase
VRKVEGDDVDVWKRVGEGGDAGVVRPIPTPDEQRSVVEPKRVPAFYERRRLDACSDRNASLDEIGGHGFDLRPPSLLPRTKKDRAPVAHESRVVDVDGVGNRPERRLREDDLDSRAFELGTKRVVFGANPTRVRLSLPAIRAPRYARIGLRRAHQDAAKRRGHALAAKCLGASLHRMETTARLSGLAAGGGCAAKYSAARLEELLSGFAPAATADLLVGLAPADDAAVYRLDDERALIFTIDFFPPMLDDPALYGAIAATNALNDVFAMGGRPLLALSIAAFPEELPVETVRAVFDAAAAKVQEAGAILAGGHTIRDEEPKYGLAVVGTVHPDGIWRKNGACAGDAVFLTKPLGTGLVVTGVRKGALAIDALEGAARWMTQLNDRAADALRPFEPSAVTDVTGFGLFGHAHEVAERSAVRLVLESARIPWMDGAKTVAESGLRTAGDPRNRDFTDGSVSLNGVPDADALVGFDPQTAGGLLITVPAEKAPVLEAEFRARDLFLARVGRVEEGSGVAVV